MIFGVGEIRLNSKDNWGCLANKQNAGEGSGLAGMAVNGKLRGDFKDRTILMKYLLKADHNDQITRVEGKEIKTIF